MHYEFSFSFAKCFRTVVAELSIKARHSIHAYSIHDYTIRTKYKSRGTYSTKPRNTPTKYNLEQSAYLRANPALTYKMSAARLVGSVSPWHWVGERRKSEAGRRG